MKNASFSIAATLILFFGLQMQANAQKTATWKGGTPGRSTDWNCPTNWKEGRVPDEFANVVIPEVSTSTFSYPVLEEGMVEVQSLVCAPGARLTVKTTARIVVLEPADARNYNQNQGMASMGLMAGVYTGRQ